MGRLLSSLGLSLPRVPGCLLVLKRVRLSSLQFQHTYLTAVSGLCLWVGNFSVFSHLPGRSFRHLRIGGRESFLEGSFLHSLAVLFIARKERGSKAAIRFQVECSFGMV